MVFRTAVVLSVIVSIVSGLPSGYTYGTLQAGGSVVRYQGPLAMINGDGSVSLTPEVQQAKDEHDSARAKELQRLEDAKNLAAANPDLTSPPQNNAQNINQKFSNQNQQNAVDGNAVTYLFNPLSLIPAPLNIDGTVDFTPEVQQAKAEHEAALEEELQRHEDAKQLTGMTLSNVQAYNQQPIASFETTYEQDYALNSEALSPAPLNSDGTVANTPEIQQANDALQAAYARVFQKLQEAETLAALNPDKTSPTQGNSNSNIVKANIQQQPITSFETTYDQNYALNSEALSPAPLNSDGTVANTPEIQQANDALQVAYDRVFQELQEAETLAALNPDKTSQIQATVKSNTVKANTQQQPALLFRRKQVAVRYNNPAALKPAPLNDDGTVALTPEVAQANAVLEAAYATQFQKLQEAEELAAANPDLTSPVKSGKQTPKPQVQQTTTTLATPLKSDNSAAQRFKSRNPIRKTA